MRCRLVVVGFRASEPFARWKALILPVSFVLLGIAAGVLRTPPPCGAESVDAKTAAKSAGTDCAALANAGKKDEQGAQDTSVAEAIQAGQPLLLPGAAPSFRPAQMPSRSSSFIWPVDGPVSSPFGWRIHPVTGEEIFHEGIDIAAGIGTNVHAAGAGTVIYLGRYGGYGRLIRISHGDGIETRYGHLSGYAVNEGEEVWAGKLIGYVGESGVATGPHLHFEVRKNNKPLNPRNHLP